MSCLSRIYPKKASFTPNPKINVTFQINRIKKKNHNGFRRQRKGSGQNSTLVQNKKIC
jgi:hypothetical protein